MNKCLLKRKLRQSMILTLNISFPQLYTYGYMDAFTSACIVMVKHALCLFLSCEHTASEKWGVLVM